MSVRAWLLAALASLAAPLAFATPGVVSGNELWVVPWTGQDFGVANVAGTRTNGLQRT